MRALAFRIARQEVRHTWRSGVLPALGLLVALLVVGAGAVGRSRLAQDLGQRARYQGMVDDQWRDQPDRHPHRVSHNGYLVFRPRAPLSVFDSGLERFTGTSIFLEAHRQNSANGSDARHDATVQRFGELTIAFVLQSIAPLLLVVVAGVSVAREREAGTLGLLLAQTVPRAGPTLGKGAGWPRHGRWPRAALGHGCGAVTGLDFERSVGR